LTDPHAPLGGCLPPLCRHLRCRRESRGVLWVGALGVTERMAGELPAAGPVWRAIGRVRLNWTDS